MNDYVLTELEHAIHYYGAELQPDGSYSDSNASETWYNTAGEFHREDGPAIVFCHGGVHWMLNGHDDSFNDWCNKVNISDETKMMLRLQYG
jgi:hypothetical protein